MAKEGSTNTEAYDEDWGSAILPVIAMGATDGSFKPVGTCWIFATAGRSALAFSATHVFDDIVRNEGSHDRQVSNVPDIFRDPKPRPVKLRATKMGCVYRPAPEEIYVADILTVTRDGLHDVAVLEIKLPDTVPANVQFSRRMEFHSGPVEQGTPLLCIGMGALAQSENWINEDEDAWYAALKLDYGYSRGQCLNYHPRAGPRGPSGPCFDLAAATLPGMSGGPVLHLGYSGETVACGVVSRGSTFEGEHYAVCSALWPAYSFTLEKLKDQDGDPVSLLKLARTGLIIDRSDGPAHFSMHTSETGESGIAWR